MKENESHIGTWKIPNMHEIGVQEGVEKKNI